MLRAQEGDGDAPLRRQAGAVEAIEQRSERAEVAADAAEQPVQHCFVQFQAAARGALAQDLAPPRFVEWLERDARALLQARTQVGKREGQHCRHRRRRVEHARTRRARGIVEMEQRHLVFAPAGDRFHAVQAHQRGARLASKRFFDPARERRQRQVTGVVLAGARLCAGREQQVGLAAALGTGQVQPVGGFAVSQRAQQFHELRIAMERAQFVVRRESQGQRYLRTHGSG